MRDRRVKIHALVQFSKLFFLLFSFSPDRTMGELDYSHEPQRDASLLVRKDKPFNAEPRMQDLIKHYITPEALMFCRSHGPIPTHLDEYTHTITIQGLGIQPQELLLRDIKKNFEKVHVMMAMQVK